jgi:magnesium transporter
VNEQNDITKNSLFEEYKIRMLWLIVGLVGSLLISTFVHSFEKTLETNLIIAAFIPLIVYVSDAVGTQMESIIIRAIAKEKKFHFGSFFLKQFFVVFLIAVTMGLLSGLSSYLLYRVYKVSIVLCFSVFFSILSSLVTGLAIPYFFWSSHQDPAEASGPVGTIIQDSLSVIIYILLANLIL